MVHGISAKSSGKVHCKEGRGIPAVGEVVTIKSEQRNRGAWVIGVIIELIAGRDGVVRGAKVRTGKSILERPGQFLYPMELNCEVATERSETLKLNPEAEIKCSECGGITDKGYCARGQC